MKVEKKIIALTVAFGLLFWVSDAFLDSYFFYEGHFQDLLLFNIPGHEIYIRSLILALFLLFGVLIARIWAKQNLAEESLRLTQFAVDHTSDEAFFMTSEGRIIYVNEAACRALEYSRHELLAMRVSDIDPMFSPEAWPDSWAKLQAGKSGIFESVHKTKDGRTYPVEVRSNLVVFDGQEYNCAFARDIRDRKKTEEALRASEERYRLLLQNANDSVFVHEVTEEGPGRFLEVNDRACRVLGYTRDEFLEMDISAIDVPEHQARIPEIMNELAGTGHAIFETEQLAKDGRRIPVEVSARLFEFQGVSAVLAVVRDISERREAEKKQEKLEKQLVQAQRMESVGRLAGGVAHDFNNMLSLILGHAELAMMQVGKEHAVYQELRTIIKASERSADLIRQLLAFARRQTANPRVLDLNHTISDMLKMLRRLIGEDIDLAWKPGTDLWPVRMDPAQVDQILANLCVNARDAIAGVGKITIETGNVVLDRTYCAEHAGFMPGRFAMLAVSDDGKGMDPETLENVFEPFFTTKAMGQGTGLGLATVYGIVKQNNGFINVYSEPGQGTTFKIYLPRTQEAKETNDDPGGITVETGSETVLLVEDEQSILALGKSLLERFGYQVIAASSPDEAFARAGEHPGLIHLLLTDVVMPEMNGKTLKARIEKLHPDIKTLFMSGYTSNVIMHQGILEPDVHFLQKPFTVHSLTSKVREVLDAAWR
ncbi:MAG: PAS domain S-box protein [Desulfohalobiaceae bacterium]|nr:PAS domain S-box protein [Desulfohalobiaceae bacterium]